MAFWSDEWVGAGAIRAGEGLLLDGGLRSKRRGGGSRVRAWDWVTTKLRRYVRQTLVRDASIVAASVVDGAVASTRCWGLWHFEVVGAHTRINARAETAAVGRTAVDVLHLVQRRGRVRSVRRGLAGGVVDASKGTRNGQLDKVVRRLEICKKVSSFDFVSRLCHVAGRCRTRKERKPPSRNHRLHARISSEGSRFVSWRGEEENSRCRNGRRSGSLARGWRESRRSCGRTPRPCAMACHGIDGIEGGLSGCPMCPSCSCRAT